MRTFKSVILGLLLLNLLILSQSHPFMIVKESEYESLRAKAGEWPWSVMKEKAVDYARNKVEYNPDLIFIRKCYITYHIVNALALSYILDPENKSEYVAKFEDVVFRYIDDIRNEKESDETPNDHGYNVGPAHAAFMVYLGLDIMYDDLDITKREEIEDDCDYIASNHKKSWYESKYSIEGMKELYHNGGASQGFIDKKNKYIHYLLSNTSEDGVYNTGPGYAFSRIFMDGRIQKKMFMDIVEYQGYNDFYDNPAFVNLYEWLFGYSVTPFNRTYTFGDSPPVKTFDQWAVSALRASQFSTNAQGYALWHLGELTEDHIYGGLFHYILYDGLPAGKIKPKSRIFKNGGAWLLDDNYSQTSLAGALWNINTQNQSHGHYDINSANIVAFGDYVLRNVGYDGWGEPDPETWQWIFRDAESSNTVLINNQNHINFKGDGITEGILGYNIEYASAHSGEVLKGGVHERNMLFIKPEGNISGYFVLLDEVKSYINDPVFNLVLHPNSIGDPYLIKENLEYDWDIKSCYTDNDIKVKIFLGNEPQAVEIKEGYRASYEECTRYIGKYMNCSFSSRGIGEVNLSTVIYPYLGETNLPKFNRIDSDSLNGIEVIFNKDVKDVVISTLSDKEKILNDISFIGNSIYYRQDKDKMKNYFARNSNKLLFKNDMITGFESEDNISIVMTGNSGEVISGGTIIKFYYPGVDNILIGNVEAKPEHEGDGWMSVFVEEGNHKIEIVADIKKR